MDDIVIRFSVRDDGSPIIEKVNQKIGKTKEVSQSLVPGLEKARTSLTGFIGANTALIGVLVGVGAALGKVLKDHIDYANQVRALSAVSGESMENTSRFIQVLDDYKISAEDALAATRALTKEGHAPNIDTLANLSDQYLSLNTVEEKNEFILKNLGRGGVAWTEVLQKGSKALREQGAAVDKNLILTQKMYDDTRRAEVAMDNFNDTIGAIKTQLAANLLPALTDSADGILWLTKTTLLFFDAVKDGKVSEFDLGKALKDTREEIIASEEAMRKNADAADLNSGALDDLTDSSKDAEEMAKRLSAVYDGLLSSMFAIEAQDRSHAQTLEDLAKRDSDLAAQKDQLTLKMWEEQRAGELTNEEYLEYVRNLDEITKAQQENSQAREDANKQNEEAGKQRVFDMVQSKLAADGLIDSGEFEYLQDLAVQKGLVSRAAADQAIAENQAADQLVAALGRSQPAMDDTLSTMQKIASYNGVVVDFGVNFSTSGSLGAAGSGYAGGGSHSVTTSGTTGRDSGGSGIAGQVYEIGPTAQPEYFVPDTNGQFYPKGKGLGPTYIVTVNNPKKETAENSIRQALKSLSFVGAAA